MVIITTAVSVNQVSNLTVVIDCLILFLCKKIYFPCHKINPPFNRNCKLVLISVEWVSAFCCQAAKEFVGIVPGPKQRPHTKYIRIHKTWYTVYMILQRAWNSIQLGLGLIMLMNPYSSVLLVTLHRFVWMWWDIIILLSRNSINLSRSGITVMWRAVSSWRMMAVSALCSTNSTSPREPTSI